MTEPLELEVDDGDTGASTKTARESLDFYPTPRNVARVLAEHLIALGAVDGITNFLDPAAGAGDLIEGMRDVAPLAETHWSAIEVHVERADALESVAESVTIGDALSVEWPAAVPIANPPFSLLDPFWLKMAAHCEQHRVWGAALTPVAWWNAEKRASYRRPDFILALGWRPSFRPMGGPAHKGSQDFCWSILSPFHAQHTQWRRVEKPREDAEPPAQSVMFG